MSGLSEKNKIEKIALIGFRGVGKSTIAKLMGQKLSLKTLSLDEYIEMQEKCSIAEIVKNHDWNHFRDLELHYLRQISDKEESLLLDTGGGILEGHDQTLSQAKQEVLKKYFYNIYIYMDDQQVLERLAQTEGSTHRPALGSGESIAQTLTRRKPWYEQTADLSVDIGSLSFQEAQQRVLEAFQKERDHA